jgi:hypothetical protein
MNKRTQRIAPMTALTNLIAIMGPRRRKGRRNPKRYLTRNLLHPKRGRIKATTGAAPKRTTSGRMVTPPPPLLL